MRVYRIMWLVGAGAVAALGLVGAVLTLPAGAMIAIAGFAAVVGCWARYRAVGVTRAGQPPIWRYGTAASTSACAGVAVVGLIASGGPLGAALLALAVASSPPALRWLGPRFGVVKRLDQQPAVEQPACAAPRPKPQVYPPPDSLTSDELCLAWRSSYTAMLRTSDVGERARLAECRRGFLDELERRDPAGFARWLADGARAASNPSRYVKPSHDTRRRNA